jgi:hypothetical protein
VGRVVCRPGSGRRSLTVTDPTLLEDLRQLLESATMGDPMRLLLWVSKSHAKLAAALRAKGHKVAKSSIPKLLSTPFHKYGDVSRGATRGGMTGSSSTKGMHHAKEKPIRNPTYQAGASRIDGAVPGVYVAVS